MSTPDPINPVPAAGAAFLTALQTFLKGEDAGRFGEMFASFVVSGGVITAGAGLTKTPTSLIAYPGGWRTTENGSITFPDSETTYVIVHKDTSGNVGTYTRVAGTHYCIDFTSGAEPALPASSARLATVVTSGGAVATVTDRRNLFAVDLAHGGLGLDGTVVTDGQLLIGDTSGPDPALVLANLGPGDVIHVIEGPGTLRLHSPALDAALYWAGA